MGSACLEEVCEQGGGGALVKTFHLELPGATEPEANITVKPKPGPTT